MNDELKIILVEMTEYSGVPMVSLWLWSFHYCCMSLVHDTLV